MQIGKKKNTKGGLPELEPTSLGKRVRNNCMEQEKKSV